LNFHCTFGIERVLNPSSTSEYDLDEKYNFNALLPIIICEFFVLK